MVQIGEAKVHWFEESCFDYGLEGFDTDGAVWLAQALPEGSLVLSLSIVD